MEKILVTGGMGYIGSHTVVELISAGYTVEILDNLCNSKKNVLDKIFEITGVKPKFHEIDLLDFKALSNVFRDGNFDCVMHFAGLKSVAESIAEPIMYYENNVGGTLNLLRCMKENGVNKIVFSSSATVYGDAGDGACREDLPAGHGIANPYGRTKYMIEEILKDVSVANPEFSAMILRYFNPIGAHSSGLIGEDPNGIPNNLMPVIMRVATGEIDELSVYGNDYPTADGSCIRDYIHVVDLARGHIAALEKMKPGVKIYNLGTGRGTSVLEMVSTFERVSGRKLPYKIAPRRAGDLAEVYADPSLALQDLGWKTSMSIDDAMRDTLHYLELCV